MKAKIRLVVYIAIIGSSLLITSCKKQDDNSVMPVETVPPAAPSFKANVDGKDFTGTSFYYRIDSSLITIGASSDNYSSIYLTLKSASSKGYYEIDNYLNIASYSTIPSVIYGTSGNVTISKMENNLISGDFNFSTTSTHVAGSFVNLPLK